MRLVSGWFKRWRRQTLISFLGLALFLAAPAVAQDETALDRYVKSADPAYGWELSGSHPGIGFAVFDVRLQSQSWRRRADVEPTFWQHWLRVYVPFQVTSTTAVLLINGGSRDGALSDPDLLDPIGLAAASAGLVTGDLRAVPNQPLQFTDEAGTRTEDAIIAYSWDKFLRTGDETWPVQLAMTKAAVAAMDAITAVSLDDRVGGHTIDSFVVGGASKRGWTAWLTGAVDKRVVALVPIVFDALNLERAFVHHWQTYGFWSQAVQDYEEMGVFAWFGSKAVRELMKAVDPFSYLDRLTMPKYLINSAGDEFFVPTSSQFYFDDLKGEKYLRYMPNVDHSLSGAETEALGAAITFAQAVVDGTPLPRYGWVLPEDGGIILTTEDQPSEVKLWQATNPSARDFRLETIRKTWTSTPVAASADGSYQASLPAPQVGWTAFFIEATYPSGGLFPFIFTTPVRVVPDFLPHGPPIASVLAASFHPLTAPGAIASAFGERFADRIEVASQLPLPTEMAGVTLRIIDSAGVTHIASLFFVSAAQINYLVPVGVAPGLGIIEVWRDGNWAAAGQILIEPLTPGLFSANGSGEGVAAAIAITVRPDETQVWEFVFDGTAPEGSREAVPINLGLQTDQVYLSLFGTGMRNASEVTATIGGEPVDATSPVESQEFEGLEQINIGPLPRSLEGAGEVEIVIIVDGIPANVITVRIL